MWKTFKWIAIVLGGVMAMLLIIFAVRVYINSIRLNARLKEIRAAGDPICIADLAPDPIPADQNAAIPLRRIRSDAEAFYKEVQDYYKSENYAAGRPTESQLAMLKAAFEAYPDLVPAIERAVALEGYDSGLDYTLSPQGFTAALIEEVSVPRSYARVMTSYVTVLRIQGRADEAVRATQPIFKLARHLDTDVILIQYLVALALRATAIDAANQALRSGPVSGEVHKLLDEELVLADPFPGYISTLKAERAFGIESFNNFPLRIQWNGEAIKYLDAMDAELRLAAQPHSSYAGTSKKPIAAPQGVFAKLVQPALQSARAATERTLATVRTLRVLNALLGREDPDAAPPTDLTKLGLPKDATIDPFNGKPLIVKRLPEGWRVYSVGSNQIDDGGKLDGFADFGVGPLEENSEAK